MLIERYDAIVIGAGQAGPALAARLGAEGLRTAIIERKLLGGTCVNVGCIPTKTLVGSARAIHMARRGGEYGVQFGRRARSTCGPSRRARTASSGSRATASTAWIAGMKNVHAAPRPGALHRAAHHRGRAGSGRLQADKIFINVGGRAVVPDMPGIKDVPFLTNSR